MHPLASHCFCDVKLQQARASQGICKIVGLCKSSTMPYIDNPMYFTRLGWTIHLCMQAYACSFAAKFLVHSKHCVLAGYPDHQDSLHTYNGSMVYIT